MDRTDLKEKTVKENLIHQGKILAFYSDTVALSDGKTATREYVKQNGAVAVVAVTEDGRILMEEQYRYAGGDIFYEIPAGKLDTPDEDPLSAAMRELREETGATAEKWTSLGEYYACPAISNEVVHLFLAEELCFGERDPDEGEYLLVSAVPPKELYRQIAENRITDGKTVAALFKYKLRTESL